MSADTPEPTREQIQKVSKIIFNDVAESTMTNVIRAFYSGDYDHLTIKEFREVMGIDFD